MKFRPWGPIDWALSLSEPKMWHVIGVIGTEERSLCAWDWLRHQGIVAGGQFAEIHDDTVEWPNKYHDRSELLLKERRDAVRNCGNIPITIHEFHLQDEPFKIKAWASLATTGDRRSVLLDISSFPKRFFFPILNSLVENPDVHNLVMTYTSPNAYAQDADLYENIAGWEPLPLFDATTSNHNLWIVSVGFLVEGINRYVAANPEVKMKLLVPFPAPLAALRKTWKSVYELEKGRSSDHSEKYRVDVLDISTAFDRIASLDPDPRKNLAFAPFGPKPISAAICLYATALQRIGRDPAVYYAQPTVYHPDYSTGIRDNDPSKAVTAYWVKHNGEFLYEK